MLFSGGKDSFLSACKTIEEGEAISMVTYVNGAGYKGENAKHGADRIIERYGKDNAEFLGVVDISGIWRNFFVPYFNMTPEEVMEKYGAVTPSQFNCTTKVLEVYR